MSNPANYYVNGEHKEFHYTPGSEIFRVEGRKGNWIPISILVFADDVDHVKQILKDFLKFRLECLIESNETHYELKERRAGIYPTIEELLGTLGEKGYSDNKDKPWDIRIFKADRNQFYKIGWAINDTLFS